MLNRDFSSNQTAYENGLNRGAMYPSAKGTNSRFVSVSAIKDNRYLANNKSHYSLHERELQSPCQIVADVLFITLLGNISGVIFDTVLHGQFLAFFGRSWCALMIASLYVVLERARVCDNGISLTDRRGRFINTMKTWSLSFAGLVFINFALRAGTDLSRGFLAIFYLIGLGTFTMWHAFAAPVIAHISQRFRRASTDWVVIGDRAGSASREVAEELKASSASRSMVVSIDAHCSEEEWSREEQMALSTVCRTLNGSTRGAIYVCSSGFSHRRLERLCSSLSVLPVCTYVIPDNCTAGFIGCKPHRLGLHIALELRRSPMNSFEMAIKRLIDIVLGSVALLLLSPIFLVTAIAIRLDTRGPILFRQSRTGKGGKPFRIFKFRSMYVMEDGPTILQACRNDPRVTRVGRFLRASSIDELPQLLNVLKGEMSLVGPRPHAIAHDKHFSQLVDNYELRQQVKPGITGWAQSNGLRGETSSVEALQRRIEHDVWYAQNVNLLLDIEIMARTVIEVVRPRNAY